MPDRPPTFFNWDEIVPRELFPGVTGQIVSGTNVMLSRVTIPAGSVVPPHSHPHEQAGWVIEGDATFTIGGVSRHLKVGDYYFIGSNVTHAVVPGPDGIVGLDVFGPPREDYLPRE